MSVSGIELYTAPTPAGWNVALDAAQSQAFARAARAIVSR